MTDSPAVNIPGATAVAEAGSLPDHEREFSELEARVAQALERARGAGMADVEASASLQGGLSATVRLGEVETIEHHRDRGISVTVYLDGRKGHASSADLAPASVQACVDRAVDIARFTEADRCNGLADPERLATRVSGPGPLAPQAAGRQSGHCTCARSRGGRPRRVAHQQFRGQLGFRQLRAVGLR